MLTSLVLEYGIKVPFRPVHIFEFLYRELKNVKGSLSPSPSG